MLLVQLYPAAAPGCFHLDLNLRPLSPKVFKGFVFVNGPPPHW
ncbi:hypothetical protein HanIR_Chr05g0244471 [Helianthus annuus]|nr:hypothetical protein HanIR_Chr05g0244471 [Helianthus annuus]